MSAVAAVPPAGTGPATSVTLLVLDREEVTLWGFAFLFGRQSWVSNCIVATHPAHALAKAREHPPDLALLDASWGHEVLGELIMDLRVLRPDVRTVLTGTSSAGGSTDLGPTVMKTWSAARMVRAVRAAVGAQQAARAPLTDANVRLSAREREVLALASRGATNREIGAQLYLSTHTVKQHTRSAYRKLEARNRADAVTRARALGLIAC